MTPMGPPPQTPATCTSYMGDSGPPLDPMLIPCLRFCYSQSLSGAVASLIDWQSPQRPCQGSLLRACAGERPCRFLEGTRVDLSEKCQVSAPRHDSSGKVPAWHE
jgi:hypothetical protein